MARTQSWDTQVLAEMVGVDDDPLEHLADSEWEAIEAKGEDDMSFGPSSDVYRAKLKESICGLIDGCGNGGCGNDDLLLGIIVRLMLARGHSHEEVGEFFGESVTNVKYLSWGQRRKPGVRHQWHEEQETPLFDSEASQEDES